MGHAITLRDTLEAQLVEDYAGATLAYSLTGRAFLCVYARERGPATARGGRSPALLKPRCLRPPKHPLGGVSGPLRRCHGSSPACHACTPVMPPGVLRCVQGPQQTAPRWERRATSGPNLHWYATLEGEPCVYLARLTQEGDLLSISHRPKRLEQWASQLLLCFVCPQVLSGINKGGNAGLPV